MNVIKCRVMVRYGNEWIEFQELPEKEKGRISGECAERMATAINDLLSDPAVFEKRCV